MTTATPGRGRPSSALVTFPVIVLSCWVTVPAKGEPASKVLSDSRQIIASIIMKARRAFRVFLLEFFMF